MAGDDESKVSFLVQPGTHTAGHFQPFEYLKVGATLDRIQGGSWHSQTAVAGPDRSGRYSQPTRRKRQYINPQVPEITASATG